MTYEYRCQKCNVVFEIRIPIDCTLVTKVTCPSCHSTNVKKLYNSIGVIFKGKGFYKNDNSKNIDKNEEV